jgi:hypothetical protein
VSRPDPQNGPFHSREQAEAVFAEFRQAAELGRSGSPGEQLVFTPRQFKAEALADAIGYWAELGDYDRQLIELLAGMLDAVDISVVCSWLYRIMQDVPGNPADQEGH